MKTKKKATNAKTRDKRVASTAKTASAAKQRNPNAKLEEQEDIAQAISSTAAAD
jgi:hypothetical protein